MKLLNRNELLKKATYTSTILGICYALIRGDFNFNGSTLELARLGVMPFIVSQGLIKTFSKLIPSLYDLTKEGEYGEEVLRKKTRNLALIIAIIQAILTSKAGDSVFQVPVSLLTSYLMQQSAEAISKDGLGNGYSQVFALQIVKALALEIANVFANNSLTSLVALGGLIVPLAGFAYTYNTLNWNLDMHNGKAKFKCPIKIGTAGIAPVLYAVAMLSMVCNIGQHPILLCGAIAFFYISQTLDSLDSNAMMQRFKKLQMYVDGVRPGKDTKELLDKSLSYALLIGIPILLFLAIYPLILVGVSGVSLGTVALATQLLVSEGCIIARQVRAYSIDYSKYKLLEV